MKESHVARYLDRFGATRPAEPDAQSLRALQLAHLRAVPFENLSIHLGEPISLESEALFDKIVNRRRGGFCYELNGLFAELLTALGYRVTLLAARVLHGARPGPLFDHLALRVDLDEPWLVDVGFGDFADEPLRLDERSEQKDDGGVFRVVPAPSGDGDLDIVHKGDQGYRLTARPYELADFVPTCWWQTTSPESHFTRSPVCSMRTAEGRTTISGRKLIHTVYGERTERVLREAELLPAYLDHFGIALDRLPSSGA
ncbi:arylamine N-acetyltransferase family protein [Nonomuraea africana]|uniref:N-hydroxyarylamine O-acetyltransferase n=1 Tax=Nonomuraea africana TaxID=46171 RepID=A0ABR9KMM3_9ACTN|nr:arylamine N-acetyltransferase [Nonomuraea africana]MBE1563021.1 N-hydroxyarylamine O-acetyltransferase [Nonomuraea africana]